MTETYEEFIALKIKEMDVHIIVLYNEYEKRTDEFHYQFAETIENTEEWFNECFIYFIYKNDNIQWINEYQLIQTDNINTLRFKEDVVRDYVYSTTHPDHQDDTYDIWLKMEINFNFINNYIINILDFEHFKNILYENGIYPEVFAEEVELK